MLRALAVDTWFSHELVHSIFHFKYATDNYSCDIHSSNDTLIFNSCIPCNASFHYSYHSTRTDCSNLAEYVITALDESQNNNIMKFVHTCTSRYGSVNISIFRTFLSCCRFQWFSPFVLDLTNTFSNQNTKLWGDLACKGWVKANLPISLCNAFLTSLQVNITEGGSCRLYDRPTTGDKPTL